VYNIRYYWVSGFFPSVIKKTRELTFCKLNLCLGPLVGGGWGAYLGLAWMKLGFWKLKVIAGIGNKINLPIQHA
jgi:hypothetical protein